MTESDKADLGVVALAVMGANLARNVARQGFGVSLFNRNAARTDALMRDHGREGRFYLPTASADSSPR
jgi:6-phosphogluconate dehydrogenase